MSNDIVESEHFWHIWIIVSISHHSSESFLLLLCASFSQSRRSARKSRSRRILSTTTHQCVALLKVHARPFSLENYWATNLLILSTRLCYRSTTVQVRCHNWQHVVQLNIFWHSGNWRIQKIRQNIAWSRNRSLSKINTVEVETD